MNAPSTLDHKPQRGSALVVVLLFLTLMSILGIAAMRTSGLEERMAGNSHDRDVALQAAEAALRDAERDVRVNINTGSSFSATCVDGLCLMSTTATPQWRTVNWNGADVREYGTRTAAGPFALAVARTPRYIVELLPDMPATSGGSLAIGGSRSSTRGGTPYRITAVGWGRRTTTQVMLQSVYVKQ